LGISSKFEMVRLPLPQKSGILVHESLEKPLFVESIIDFQKL